MTMADTTSSPDELSPGLRTMPNPKWIRAHLGDVLVVDSRDALLVWENPHYPQWYFPESDVFGELRATDQTIPTEDRGDAVVLDLVVGDTTLPGAAKRFPDAPGGVLDGRVRIDWTALDNWLEEGVEVIVHPRSPFTRCDVLPSSRHVQIVVDGTLVADSHRPTLLFETGLPTRYYLPPEDVRLDLLRPTGTKTGCPYKGIADYWSLVIGDVVHDDIVWGYPTPLPEVAGIAGKLCFFDERVDLEVDGVGA